MHGPIEPSLQEFVRAHKGKTVDQITELVLKSGQRLIRAFVNYGVARAVNDLKHHERDVDKFATPAMTSKDETPAGFKVYEWSEKENMKIAAALRGVLRDWRIGDTPLGLMTAEELAAESAEDRRNGDGLIRNADFYDHLLAKTKKPEQRICEVWSNAAAERAKKKFWPTEGEK